MDERVPGKNRKSAKQMFHYALVGIASNLTGYLVYLLLTYLGCPPKMTMSILYGLGASVSFWGNSQLTFSHKGSLLGAGVRYIIAHFFGYFINLAILIFFVDKLGYAHQWVQALAIIIVAIFLFVIFKYFVFNERMQRDIKI
ncbi:MAG: GtrA family protein [Gallionella sp.]|nr:GtrA family protein [Gallionella sp.]